MRKGWWCAAGLAIAVVASSCGDADRPERATAPTNATPTPAELTTTVAPAATPAGRPDAAGLLACADLETITGPYDPAATPTPEPVTRQAHLEAVASELRDIAGGADIGVFVDRPLDRVRVVYEPGDLDTAWAMATRTSADDVCFSQPIQRLIDPEGLVTEVIREADIGATLDEATRRAVADGPVVIRDPSGAVTAMWSGTSCDQSAITLSANSLVVSVLRRLAPCRPRGVIDRVTVRLSGAVPVSELTVVVDRSGLVEAARWELSAGAVVDYSSRTTYDGRTLRTHLADVPCDRAVPTIVVTGGPHGVFAGVQRSQLTDPGRRPDDCRGLGKLTLQLREHTDPGNSGSHVRD